MKPFTLLTFLFFAAMTSNLLAGDSEPAIFEFDLKGIVSIDDGKPVPGTVVHLSYNAYYLDNSNNEQRIYAKPLESDENGRFTFLVPAVIDDVYISAMLPDTDLCGAVQLERFDGLIEDSPPLQNVVLQKGRTVSGTVRDADGRPVVGTFLAANLYPHFTTEPTLTDEKGGFKFHTLSGRIVSVYAYKPGAGIAIHNPRELSSKDKPVEELPQELGPLNLTLRPLKKIPVSIENKDGHPVEGIRVELGHLEIDRNLSLDFKLAASSDTAIERKLFTAISDKNGKAVINWLPREFNHATVFINETERWREYKGMEIAYLPNDEIVLSGSERELNLAISYGYYMRGKILDPEGDRRIQPLEKRYYMRGKILDPEGKPFKSSYISKFKITFLENYLGKSRPELRTVTPGIVSDRNGRFAFIWDGTAFNILQLALPGMSGEIPELAAKSIVLPELKRGQKFTPQEAPLEIRLEKGTKCRINVVAPENEKPTGRISILEIIELKGNEEIVCGRELPANKEGIHETRLPSGKYRVTFNPAGNTFRPVEQEFEIADEDEVELELELKKTGT